MTFTRGLLLAASVLALGACSNFKSQTEVEALNEAQPVGSPFTQHLAAEYRDFANEEQNVMFDYPDALHFARKGLAAAAGEVVLPEPVSDWNLKPEHVQELSTARARLIAALDSGAREVSAQQAATAQAKFDCWIEQQEENWQTDDIVACKKGFQDAMSALDGLIEKAPEDVLPPVADTGIDASQPMAPEDAMYLVFFDFDSSKIAAGGDSVLDAVATELKKQAKLVAIKVVGHTDTSGPQSYNDKLAIRRANAVRKALVARGVDASLLKVEGRGENELLVKTADGVREPANRRVNISFE